MKPTWNFMICCLFVSLAICTPASSAEPNAEDVQGFWFGDGSHPLSKNVLLIQNDEFIVISPLGRFASTCVLGETTDGLTAIDIDRYDGKHQLGVYMVDKTKLYLKLAAPGESRPTKKVVTFPNGKPHWHTIFDRRPTKDGLTVLHKDLRSEFGMDANTVVTKSKN